MMTWTRNSLATRSFLLAGLLLAVALSGAAGSAALAPTGSTLLPTASASADLVINVEDAVLPAYADETTGLPVSVVFAGSAVRWFWVGTQSHSVTQGLASATGPDGDFDSGIRHAENEPENGGSAAFIVTFDNPGVYKYYCEIHQVQHGILIVV